jgi:uncharacterized protein YndB with AHSA1/START domain
VTPTNVLEQATEPQLLVVSAEYSLTPPERTFAYWTQPDLLVRWWPQTAETDAQVGGHYYFAWPAMDWHLRGRYTVVEPGRRLAFTWRWDGEPSEHIKDVEIRFEPLSSGGTRLTVTHGPYDDSTEGRETRQGHLDGWRHFLPRLSDALAAEAETSP